MLEPEVFAATYAVLPEGIDKRTKEGKLEWATWEEEHPDMVPVAKPTMIELAAMRDSLLSHPLVSVAIDGALCERSAFWIDTTENGEVECKARPDLLMTTGFLGDLKTCQDARPEAFARDCWTYRYHVQAAYYLDGLMAALGHQPEGFVFFAIEKSPPYAVATYLANEEMIDQGRREYQRDLELFTECRAKDDWPGYTTEVLSIMLPGWAQGVI
jgi:hypothetical protein